MSFVPERKPSSPAVEALRVPPHSIDAEQAVLGGLMLTQEAFDHPPRDVAAALAQRGLPQDRVWLMRHGETRAVPM